MGYSVTSAVWWGAAEPEESAWEERYRELNDDHYDLVAAVEERLGVVLSEHGHYELIRPYLYIKESQQLNHRWAAATFDPTKCVVGADWEQRLREAAAELGFPLEAVAKFDWWTVPAPTIGWHRSGGYG